MPLQVLRPDIVSQEGREYPLPELMEEEEIKYSSDQVAFILAAPKHIQVLSSSFFLLRWPFGLMETI